MNYSAFDKRVTSRDFSKKQLKDAGIDTSLSSIVPYNDIEYTLLKFATDNNLKFYRDRYARGRNAAEQLRKVSDAVKRDGVKDLWMQPN